MKLRRRGLAAACAIVLVSGLVAGQPMEQRRMFISGGVALPVTPQTFYDYWGHGPSVNGGILFRVSDAMYYGVEGEFAYFPLDVERYIKGLRIPQGSGSVGGGGAVLVSAGGRFGMTTTDPREYVQVSGDVGLGMLASIARGSSGTFSGYNVNNEGSVFGAMVLSAAGRGVLRQVGPWRIAIEGRYRLRLFGSELANAAYSSVRLHFSRSISGES
jgi:hypothetical protein